jgi:hypothetical protein
LRFRGRQQQTTQQSSSTAPMLHLKFAE